MLFEIYTAGILLTAVLIARHMTKDGYELIPVLVVGGFGGVFWPVFCLLAGFGIVRSINKNDN